MNKILNINLGGYALTIDEDAYDDLQAYLDSIRQRFSESEGRDEILGDIETRLGEIITQGMGSRSIVMLPDVESATTLMGKPEDFGSSDAAESTKTGGGRNKSTFVPPIRTGKRLFRDEDDAVVGGVCSGLTAYFGFHDPVWMRLAFVLVAFLSFGFWVPAYLLMWILVQPARSTADRLAMRGEPVNVDNIAREIEEGFDRLGTKVNEFGSATSKTGTSGVKNALNTGVRAIGQFFAFAVRFVTKFASFIALLIAIVLFLSFGGAWIAGIWTLITAAPLVDYVSPLSGTSTWLAFANLFFFLGIPIISLALFFVRLLFKIRLAKWFHGGLWLFWTLNLISVILLTSLGVKEFRQSASISHAVNLSNIQSDTLRVEGISMGSNDNAQFWDFNNDDIRLNHTSLEMNGLIEIRIKKSKSGRFECLQTTTARGNSYEDALENANQTTFNVTTADNTLLIPSRLTIPKGTKWKAQAIKITIGVPEGKFITFNDAIYQRVETDSDEYAQDKDEEYISRRPNKLFQMTTDGLLCADCPKLGDKDFRTDRNYEHFILEGDFKTDIQQGESFNVRIDGPEHLKNLVKMIKTGDKITFTTEGKVTDGAVHVLIVTPSFSSLHVEGAGEVVIRGFEVGEAAISARGSSRIKAYIDATSSLDATLSGNCSVEITGKGGDLRANLTDGATLIASNWRAENAEISASDGSKSKLYVKNTALVLSDDTSIVKVDGGATIKRE
jgi:phage shock protein PspC (stress-responsive transcriptional regulator)